MLINRIYENRYSDSVFLMLIARNVSEKDGISEVSAMMGTDNNKEILAEGGFLSPEGDKAGPNDLLVCVTGDDPKIIENAFEELNDLLEGKNSDQKSSDSDGFNDFDDDEFLPRTLDSAMNMMRSSNLVFISLPGEYAYREALKAVRNNKHVMLFSDNVTIEEELSLKQEASKRGLIVMGPDCGTAIINNRALGFANVVSKGSIGVAAASGTGLQAFTCLVNSMGGGISQALGLGGRDLSKDIGGISILTALDALEKDINTKIISIVSKPPHESVAEKVYQKIENLSKPCVVCFLGRDTSEAVKRGIKSASTLEEAAALAVSLSNEISGSNGSESNNFKSEIDAVLREIITASGGISSVSERLQNGHIRGLYSGGTLCDEAIFTLSKRDIDIWSNIYVSENRRLKKADGMKGTCLIDLGEDEFTVGVPHPMIDFHLRCQWIEKALEMDDTAILLFDVVLGYGSHEDPAGQLINAIEAGLNKRKSSKIPILVASVCGTTDDPQGYADQVSRLKDAGVRLLSTNARAADVCGRLITGDLPQMSEGGELNKLFESSLGVITMGLSSFCDDLKKQGTRALHCDWRPPADGDKKMISILDRLQGLK